MKKGKGLLIFSVFVSLAAVFTASFSTYAWFQLAYQNNMSYSTATIETTDTNLLIEIDNSYSGRTINRPTSISGINHWELQFNSYLDDLSYNGNPFTPFIKIDWAEGGLLSGGIGSEAESAARCGIATGKTNGFYLFKVTFTNDSASSDIHVYLGSGSSLTKAVDDTASTNAALCERVAIRTTDAQGKNISYWIPNRNSGAMMVGYSESALTWTDAVTPVYGLANYYLGAPEKANSPINRNRPASFDTNNRYPNVVHYGDFNDITEGSTNCDVGQYVCTVPHGNPNTYSIYVVMWAEGTDLACNSNALSGVTKLNLEFVALSKQVWPA